MRRARGLTLVELLLSIALALFLVAAILQVYRIGKSVLRWQVEVARMEENGRHALALLVRELRMAGFFGRQTTADLPAPAPGAPACADSPGWVLDLQTPLDMLDNFAGGQVRLASGTQLLCLPTSRLMRGSDALVIKRSAALPSGSAGHEPAMRDFTRSRWYLVTYAPDPGLTVFVDAAGDPSQAVPSAATWWQLHSHIFYIRDYSQDPGDAVPALCDERLGSAMRSVCLVEGVERLQLEFGIDSDADGIADSLLRAPTPALLARAVSVHVHLQIRSLRQLHRRPRAQSLQLGTTVVDLPADRYLRRVFSATVPLYNMPLRAGAHALP